MKTVLHKANTRGSVDFGWLKSKHTFSFGSYYDADRTNFGVLRVLNDDHVIGGAGFGTHPHKNMEIISIPLEGEMEHKDSMNNIVKIAPNKIQSMSAGSGITHSEYNSSETNDLKFLQIWVVPNQLNVTPRYDEYIVDEAKLENQWAQILSPNQNEDGVSIHQDAWFYLSNLEEGNSLEYQLKSRANGVYVFLIDGEISLNDIQLSKRDGLGIWDINDLKIVANQKSRILLMEVPLK
jgi:quercetin 2,3-dioxygenase